MRCTQAAPVLRRTQLAALVVGLALGLTWYGGAAAMTAPELGKPAPTFEGVDSHGKPHALADYRGKVVVLEWTNHGCPYVGKHYGTGNMQALQKEAAEKGVVWLSVISSAPGTQGHVSPKQANELTETRDAAPAAVLLDPEGEIGQLYAAKVTPHMYVIDVQGRLVYMGAIDDKPTARYADVETATNYVRAALDDVLAGKAVSTPYSRAYGCTVKYAF
jgi:peroxiredoxin